MKISTKLAIPVLLCIILMLGSFIRYEYRHIYENYYGRKLPFTLESALLYRYASMTAQGIAIPEIDKAFYYPGGFHPREHFSLGSDYATGLLYRIFPFKSIPFSDFLRILMPLFFVLGIFPLYGITYILTKNRFVSVLASLFYATAPAALIRSTGIEFSRENFALPFLLFHCFLFMKLLEKSRNDKKVSFLSHIFIALTLVCSLILWDLSQYYLYLNSLFYLGIYFMGKENTGIRNQLYIQSTVLLFAGLYFPYLRAHVFYFSFPVLLLLALCIISYVFKKSTITNRRILLGILLFAVALITSLSLYKENYGHFFSLIVSKIKHLNIRPLDPARLPQEVRLLWTPALHSPFEKLFGYRPIDRMLPALSLILFIPFYIIQHKKKSHRWLLEEIFFLLFLFSSLIVYSLFTRFEVFLICFLSVFFGLSLYYSHFFRRIIRYLLYGLVLSVFVLQTQITMKKVHYAGRSFFYSETDELLNWVRNNTDRKVRILASFGISPSLVTYAERDIVLQPKFEKKISRNLVLKYAQALFSHEQKPFYDFCVETGTQYFVYNKGTASDCSPYSWRYICNQLDKEQVKKSLAYRFETRKDSFDRFIPEFENGKFIVYRVLLPDEKLKTNRLYNEAVKLFDKEHYKDAALLLNEVLQINPRHTKARFLTAKVYQILGFHEKAVEQTKKGLQEIQYRRQYSQ